jgi:hypothetical protein
MAQHKFKLGQIVEPAGRTATSGDAHYEIVGLVPSEGQEPCYRVRRAGAPDRVVRESQITFVAEAKVKSDRPSISISKS